jgi:hypothetical protein
MFNASVSLKMRSLRSVKKRSPNRVCVVSGGIATLAWLFVYSYADYKIESIFTDYEKYFKP